MTGIASIPETIKHLHIWNGSNYATINSFTSLVNRRFDREEHFFVCIDSELIHKSHYAIHIITR